MVLFEFVPFIQNHLPNVIAKGVSEPPPSINGRVAWETSCLLKTKHKVPRSYSGAEDDAPSLTEARDDDLFIRIGMLILTLRQSNRPLSWTIGAIARAFMRK